MAEMTTPSHHNIVCYKVYKAFLTFDFIAQTVDIAYTLHKIHLQIMRNPQLGLHMGKNNLGTLPLFLVGTWTLWIFHPQNVTLIFP